MFVLTVSPETGPHDSLTSLCVCVCVDVSVREREKLICGVFAIVCNVRYRELKGKVFLKVEIL